MPNLVAEAITLIKEAEGYHRRLADGRAAPYLCPANVWTIGWGSTRNLANGPIARDMPAITVEEATQLFERDVAVFRMGTLRLVTRPLNDFQIGALTSFAYNLGLGRLRASTLLRRVNEGNMVAAANEFPKWVMAGGQRLNGLIIRRERERLLFMRRAEAPAPLGTAESRTESQVLSRFNEAFSRAFTGSAQTQG